MSNMNNRGNITTQYSLIAFSSGHRVARRARRMERLIRRQLREFYRIKAKKTIMYDDFDNWILTLEQGLK